MGGRGGEGKGKERREEHYLVIAVSGGSRCSFGQVHQSPV